MARITEASDGVPPKAGPPPLVLTTCAPLRPVPLTSQIAGSVVFTELSTPGLTSQEPQRKSVPNQATTSDAALRLRHEVVSWSSDTLQSLRTPEACAFSVSVTPSSTSRVTIVVS